MVVKGLREPVVFGGLSARCSTCFQITVLNFTPQVGC